MNCFSRSSTKETLALWPFTIDLEPPFSNAILWKAVRYEITFEGSASTILEGPFLKEFKVMIAMDATKNMKTLVTENEEKKGDGSFIRITIRIKS